MSLGPRPSLISDISPTFEVKGECALCCNCAHHQAPNKINTSVFPSSLQRLWKTKQTIRVDLETTALSLMTQPHGLAVMMEGLTATAKTLRSWSP